MTKQPITHREFLKSLSRDERVQLTSTTNSHALLRLLVLVCSQISLATWIANGWTAWPLALIPLGLLNISLFHIMHECIHWTAFRTRLLNRLIAVCCGFVLFLPSEWFRFFHVAHHRYTQDQARDPELMSLKPRSRRAWLVHLSGIRIWLDSARLLWSGVRGQVQDDFIPVDQRAAVIKEIRLMSGAYALLFIVSLILKSSVLLWIWLLPNLLGQPFLRLYLLAEHGNCAFSDNMFENTRTVFTHPLIRWFTWNMPYHTEHHAYAAVPFHRLPELHLIMQDNLVNTSDGYIGFNSKYIEKISV